MSDKHVTFNDIARYTGFSKTTVSRFFNKPGSLTQKNQEIIRQALVDLDYKENKVAQILAKGKTEFVGILIPGLFPHYFSEMLNQILQTYETYGYKFLVFEQGKSEDAERKYLEELLSYQVEGLIVLSHTICSKELSCLPIPVVSIEREDACINSVNCDNYNGAILAVQLLLEHHCDVLLHINTPTDPSIPAYKRITGFQDYCRENSLEHEVLVYEAGYSYASGIQAMAGLLEDIEKRHKSRKIGLFFSDDSRANCFLNLLVRKYGTLPENYRLVGFDNSPIAREAVFTLSTIAQPIDRMAQEAVSLLDHLIREAKHKASDTRPCPIHKVISPVLIRRESTEGVL